MRRVYTPPPSKSGQVWPILGALLLTLCVFLVLPLTQMVSSGLGPSLNVTKVDAAQLQAPESEPEPPPPPPEEKQEEPPPPDLTDTAPPMNLNIDLDFAFGGGGVMAGLGQFAAGEGDGKSLLDTFSVADLEKRPELVAAIDPVYPSEMRRARVEGTVTLVFVLDENGRVEDPRVEKSSRSEFEKPALDAVRKWKFRPGMKDGAAVRTYMRQPIRFSLNG